MDVPSELIEAAELAAETIMGLPGVVGLGPGLLEQDGELLDELAVRVLVADAAQIADGLPDEIGGAPVCVVEFDVTPLTVIPDTARHQELAGGCMIQVSGLGPGTLGAIVTASEGALWGLTNYHVAGDVGTAVFQPDAPPAGAGSVGSIGEVVVCESPATAPLAVPSGPFLVMGSTIDASLFNLNAAFQDGRTATTEILDGLGAVDGTRSPVVREFVRKRGSTTRDRSGQVIGGPHLVKWVPDGFPPPSGREYWMRGQFELFSADSEFAAGGDSGSVVLAQGTHTAVGLLWGGSQGPSRRGLMCDITEVEIRLGVSVATVL